MPTHPVIRYIDEAFPAPGLEGDVLLGLEGPCFYLLGLQQLPSRAWVTADFNQPRDNWLGIHAAHDYAPPWDGPGEIWIGVQDPGRPIWFQRWNGISGPGGGYGNALLVEHEDGELSLYAHFAQFSPRIARWISAGGSAASAPWLERGILVGEMGNTGNVWGTRPDGSVGPPPAGDLGTGKHLHFERRASAALGNVLIDPASRMEFVQVGAVDVSAPVPLPAPNPVPNQPVLLGPVQARAEAQLLYRLVLDMLDHPIESADPYGDAIDALQREVGELVRAYGNVAPVNEARMLAQTLDVLKVNPVGYSAMLAAVRGQVGELLFEIQKAVP